MHFVTSDLHGYPHARFLSLLEKAGFGKDDELYVLGDVIDRNGDGGIETLLWMSEQENVHFIMGNHEHFMLACGFLFDEITEKGADELTTDKLETAAVWLRNGAYPTVQSLKALAAKDRDRLDGLMEYLREAPLYELLKIKRKMYVLVHAGLGNFSKKKDLDDYTADELLWTRPHPDEKWFRKATVILGHTPVSYYGSRYAGRIFRADSFIDIDTGAASGGSPTVLRLEDEMPFYAEE